MFTVRVLRGYMVRATFAVVACRVAMGHKRTVAHRRFGQDRGLFQVPEDFNAPLPEELQRRFESGLGR